MTVVATQFKLIRDCLRLEHEQQMLVKALLFGRTDETGRLQKLHYILNILVNLMVWTLEVVLLGRTRGDGID